MSTLEHLFQELLAREDLSKNDRAKVEKLSGRWDEGIIPNPNTIDWARKLLESKTEIRICKHFKDKMCFHREKRDPIHGAVPCDFMENQKKCKLYQKGEI